jgi:hypothetical protein
MPLFSGGAGRAPDAVEGILQFPEYRGGANDQTHTLIEVAMMPSLGALALAISPLYRPGALLSDEAAQLLGDLAPYCFLPEDQPGHRDDDDEQRSNRKDRVVRERRPHARGVVIAPRRHRFFDQQPQAI